MIFFSAHGVPETYVRDAGDPYKDHMEECIYLIMQELKARGVDNDHKLAYQVIHLIINVSLAFSPMIVSLSLTSVTLFYIRVELGPFSG